MPDGSDAAPAIVADDLTGAGDAGIQCTKAGARTTVWLDPARALDDTASDVIVVDMNSRALTPDEAYARMRDFGAELARRSPRRIVKKMDSTLRGNAGPEVRALLEALPAAFAVVAPAYPKNGRTCVNGVLLVDGTPVDRTDFGRDLFSPVRDARVAALFPEATLHLTLAVIRAGPAAIAAELSAARARGIRIATADAHNDDDLRALVAVDALLRDLLWTGSAGLLEMMPLRPRTGIAAPPALPRVAGPLLFVVGSVSAMTQRQIAAFAAHHAGETRLLDPLDVLAGRTATAVSRATEALARGRDVLFALDEGGERITAAQPVAQLLARFVDAASAIVARAAPAAVMLSGGDVARAFCEAQGIRGLTLLAETAPGIPVSRAMDPDMLLVTKAGGFGRPDTYRDIMTSLRPQEAR